MRFAHPSGRRLQRRPQPRFRSPHRRPVGENPALETRPAQDPRHRQGPAASLLGRSRAPAAAARVAGRQPGSISHRLRQPGGDRSSEKPDADPAGAGGVISTGCYRGADPLDSGLAAAASRGICIDDQDRRAGLLRIVGSMEAFAPAVAALEAAGVYTAEALRAHLGRVADKVKADKVGSKSAFLASGGGSGRGRTPGPRSKAIKALAAQLGAAAVAPVPTGAAKPLGKHMCRLFQNKGSCRYGAACKFSHDLLQAGKRQAFLAACELFYDGGSAPLPVVMVAVVLQAVHLGRALESLDLTAITDLLNRGEPVATVGVLPVPLVAVAPNCPLAAVPRLSESESGWVRVGRQACSRVSLPSPRPRVEQGGASAFAMHNQYGVLAGPLNDSGADESFIGVAISRFLWETSVPKLSSCK